MTIDLRVGDALALMREIGQRPPCRVCGKQCPIWEGRPARSRVYCSAACKLQWDRERVAMRRPATPASTCPGCGKQVTPRIGGGIARKWCSSACRQKTLYHTDPNKARGTSNAWRRANLDKARAQQRAGYHNNPAFRAKKMAWHTANRDRINAIRRTRVQENPEKHRAVQRVWRAANRERLNALQRAKFRERKYGLRQSAYALLIHTQGNKCAICGASPNGKPLAVDHCHETRRVRGLLCQQCNLGLGRFKDNTDLLLAAAAYLARRRIATDCPLFQEAAE